MQHTEKSWDRSRLPLYYITFLFNPLETEDVNACSFAIRISALYSWILRLQLLSSLWLLLSDSHLHDEPYVQTAGASTWPGMPLKSPSIRLAFDDTFTHSHCLDDSFSFPQKRSWKVDWPQNTFPLCPSYVSPGPDDMAAFLYWIVVSEDKTKIRLRTLRLRNETNPVQNCKERLNFRSESWSWLWVRLQSSLCCSLDSIGSPPFCAVTQMSAIITNELISRRLPPSLLLELIGALKCH